MSSSGLSQGTWRLGPVTGARSSQVQRAQACSVKWLYCSRQCMANQPCSELAAAKQRKGMAVMHPLGVATRPLTRVCSCHPCNTAVYGTQARVLPPPQPQQRMVPPYAVQFRGIQYGRPSAYVKLGLL